MPFAWPWLLFVDITALLYWTDEASDEDEENGGWGGMKKVEFRR